MQIYQNEASNFDKEKCDIWKSLIQQK